MPLESPQLDNRNFDDLFAEAKLRLQRYCPEWTDFNDSDPGIALVQLFAWLTELLIFKINQVPERNYIEFLKNLKLERHTARPARTRVVLTTSPPTDEVSIQNVSARAKFMVPAATGDVLTFESLEAIDLVNYPLDSVQVFDGLEYTDHSALNTAGNQSFRPLGWTPQLGNALYLGFQPPQGTKECLFPDRVVLNFFAPAEALAATRSNGGVASGQKLPELLWEYASKFDRDRTATTPRPFQADRWRPLDVIIDETHSLTTDGRVVLRGPGADCIATVSPRKMDDAERFWIRCRLVGGKYTHEQIPECGFVRCNVVEIENLATQVNEVLAVGDGTQFEFQLQNVPVAAESLDLVLVESTEHVVGCEPREDFLDSGPEDLHFTLNPNSGVIRFGNGKHGRVPGPGQRLVARSYRAGGGVRGNVKPNSVQDPPLGTVGLSVTNPRAATGGADEETLESLLERAPRVLRGDARAVTKDDYRRFAESVPGVGRAIVIPQYLQQHPGLNIPGALTVAIVPNAPQPRPDGTLGPPRFLPAAELLDAVALRIDEVRPAGVEVAVASPRLRELELFVDVTKTNVVKEPQAREQLKLVLERYFSPVDTLRTTPDNTPPTKLRRDDRPAHWEIETPIYPSRLYEVLFEAVDEQSGLELVQDIVELRLLDHGVEIPAGRSLSLAADELPLVSIHVRIVPSMKRRTP